MTNDIAINDTLSLLFPNFLSDNTKKVVRLQLRTIESSTTLKVRKRCLAWARSETAFSTGFIFAVINAMFQFCLRQRSNKFILEFRALARCFGP